MSLLLMKERGNSDEYEFIFLTIKIIKNEYRSSHFVFFGIGKYITLIEIVDK